MLQGHGGDELFWGYQWVQQAVEESIRKYHLLTQGNKVAYFRPTSPKGENIHELLKWSFSLAGIIPSWKAYKRDKQSPPDQLVFMDKTPDFQIAGKSARNLYSSEFFNKINKNTPYDIFTIPQPWKRVDIQISRLIVHTYLLENGIAQGDRLSMASSVELRLPLLDYRLIEVVMGLRKSSPDHMFAPKTWFKMALKDILPRSVLNRPKSGFTPPVKDWHRALFETYGPILKDGILVQNNVLNRKSAIILSKGLYPKGAIMSPSFKALVLEMWVREMLNEKKNN